MADIDDIDGVHKELGFLLLSGGWCDVMKPAISERVRGLYGKLIDPSTNRKGLLPDDFIRGQIAALRWVVEWPEKEMQRASVALKERELRKGGEGPTPSLIN